MNRYFAILLFAFLLTFAASQTSSSSSSSSSTVVTSSSSSTSTVTPTADAPTTCKLTDSAQALSTNECFKKVQNVIACMTPCEQELWVKAYNSNTDTNRCFDCSLIKDSELKSCSVKNANAVVTEFGKKNKKDRNAFSCLKAFQEQTLGTSDTDAAATTDTQLTNVINQQSNTSQCYINFITSLLNVNIGRRRYLCLPNELRASVVLSADNDGKVTQFKFSATEANTIVGTFNAYADCKAQLGTTLSEAVNNVTQQAAVSPKCAPGDSSMVDPAAGTVPAGTNTSGNGMIGGDAMPPSGATASATGTVNGTATGSASISGTVSTSAGHLRYLADNAKATTTSGSGSQPSGASGSQPSGASGSQPSGASGSQPSGASGSQPSGASGSQPSGASGSKPSGASGSQPSGASGSQPSGASGSQPSGASGSMPSGGKPLGKPQKNVNLGSDISTFFDNLVKDAAGYTTLITGLNNAKTSIQTNGLICDPSALDRLVANIQQSEEKNKKAIKELLTLAKATNTCDTTTKFLITIANKEVKCEGSCPNGFTGFQFNWVSEAKADTNFAIYAGCVSGAKFLFANITNKKGDQIIQLRYNKDTTRFDLTQRCQQRTKNCVPGAKRNPNANDGACPADKLKKECTEALDKICGQTGLNTTITNMVPTGTATKPPACVNVDPNIQVAASISASSAGTIGATDASLSVTPDANTVACLSYITNTFINGLSANTENTVDINTSALSSVTIEASASATTGTRILDNSSMIDSNPATTKTAFTATVTANDISANPEAGAQNDVTTTAAVNTISADFMKAGFAVLFLAFLI
jgi:hypothetical protein